MKRFIFIPLLFLLKSALADTQAFGGQFQGINNGDASILIGDNEAQDASNVDITDNQYGIKKRAGYSQFQTIGVSTWPVRGGYFYTDVNGNKLLVNASSTTIYKSLNSGPYASIVTTDTAGSYYDFTDSQGYLWRANSNRDEIFRYDGSNRTYYPSTPKGNQIEAMPDRLAISGTSANPNRVNFSAAADFTTFTTGILDTSAFTEDFSLPGQAINAIKYALGRLFAWTNTTTSYWAGSNQFDGIIKDVSTNIGCNQPDSVLYDDSTIFWQAQDKHFYSYDGNAIRKLSGKISGSVSGFVGGETKLMTISEQADWDLGTSSQVSTSISVGDVVLSTWTGVDTSSTDFGSGTLFYCSTGITAGSLYASLLINPGFEGGTGTDANGWTGESVGVLERDTSSPRTGSADVKLTEGLPSCGTNQADFGITIKSSTGSYTYSINTITGESLSSSYALQTIPLPSAGSFIHARIDKYHNTIVGSCPTTSWSHNSGTDAELLSTQFVSDGGNLTFYAKFDSGTGIFNLDDFSTANSSSVFTSRSFDTTFSSSPWLSSTADWTANGNSIVTQTQASSDGSTWDTAVTWTTGTAPTSSFKRYIRYIWSASTTSASTGLPFLDSATLNSRAATGTWTSSALTIGSGITSWGNFGADTTLNGGTVNFAVRTATSAAMLTSASYAGVTNNTQITASTNPYAQLKFDSSITFATQTPTVSNFTLFWNEGTPTHTYGTIDKNHRLLWSLAENGSTANNVTYIYDQRFDSWLKYSVPFDSPVRVGDSTYFGGASTGVVYIWPTGTNDAGSAITAYWKTKDFIGTDPFVEKAYNTVSLVAATQSGSSLTLDTFINGVTTSTKTFTVSLTNSTMPFIRFNDRFPNGTAGTLINFKFGNTAADSPFEFYSARYDYTPKAWRVLP